jgi:hypothetical protein
MKKISDEEFDREMSEFKVHLNVLMELLQKYEEDQRYGWTMKKKKVRWTFTTGEAKAKDVCQSAGRTQRS